MFFNKNNENIPCNPYYMGDGCFNFPGLYESFSLRIIGNIELNGYSNLYVCNLCYSCNDKSSMNKPLDENEKEYSGFNIDEMIYDSKYTRFVFDRVINRRNLMKIDDFNYDFIDPNMGINYIGSVLEFNDNIVVYDDDNIRRLVRFSSHTKNNRVMSNDDLDSRRERAFMSSINRQGKSLRKKLEFVQSDNYKKNNK